MKFYLMRLYYLCFLKMVGIALFLLRTDLLIMKDQIIDFRHRFCFDSQICFQFD